MLSNNIEIIGANSRLILTMTTIITYRFFVNAQIHNIFYKLIQFHLCKFYAKYIYIYMYKCKDRIWVGPKIGLDFSPISPNNEFVESE